MNGHKLVSGILEPQHLSDFPPGTALTMSDIENFHLARNDFDACTRNTFKNLLEDGEVIALTEKTASTCIEMMTNIALEKQKETPKTICLSKIVPMVVTNECCEVGKELP